MSLILSHKTARLVYQSVARPSYRDVPVEGRRTTPSMLPPTLALVRQARDLLRYYGVPAEDLETLDVLTASKADRRNLSGVACHWCAHDLPVQSFRQVLEDIYVVSPALCALQATQDLDFWECVEFFNQLCSCYRLSFSTEGGYAECQPATTVADLSAFFDAHPGMHGMTKARRALRYTRDRARSPMETALLMMLAMPRNEGGLGIRGIELDHLIPVTGYAAKLTSSSCFYADIFIRSALLVIEYNGREHDDPQRTARDNERENALRAMGYEVIVLSKKNVFDAESFRRSAAAICRCVGIRPSRFPDEFAYRQNKLRKFALRRVLQPHLVPDPAAWEPEQWLEDLDRDPWSDDGYRYEQLADGCETAADGGSIADDVSAADGEFIEDEYGFFADGEPPEEWDLSGWEDRSSVE